MRVTPGQSRTQSWANSAWEPVRQSVVVVLGSLHPPGSEWVTMCTLTLIRSLGLGRGQIAPWVFPHSLSSTYIPEVTRGGSSPERGAGAWWSWTPEPNDGVSGLALFPVGRPFVHVGHVLVSLSWCLHLSFSHSSCFFLKSLKKKLTMLQETLNLPPVASETVNRLVLERFVDPLGWCRDPKLEERPGRGLCSWLWWGRWSMWV